MAEDDYKVELHKVVLVGDGGVGKSAITIQLTQGHFIIDYDPTIENCYRKTLTVDGRICVLDILDTAGQEEYASMLDQYFRNGHGFLIVYSVTDRNSFESIKNYYNKILRVKEESSFPIVFVANKVDLVKDRDVTEKEGKEKAEESNVKYIETSAKNKLNIEDAFYMLVREIRKQQSAGDGGVDDKKQPKKDKKKGGCSLL
ncbi:small monomeric GTPase [Entamoeba marina]